MGGGGVGAAVAHHGASCLAALVPVIAATSRGRRGAGLTSWDFCNVFRCRSISRFSFVSNNESHFLNVTLFECKSVRVLEC